MKRDYELELYKSEVEKLKLELEIEKSNKSSSSNYKDSKDVTELVEVASEMRQLLNEVRNTQINVNLAKKIDFVLRRASYLD